MSPDYLSPTNVLVVSFDDPENDANAYQALTDLKQLDSQGQGGERRAISARRARRSAS